MSLFESTLLLLVVAVILLRVSGRTSVPYPTMLAVAGVFLGGLHWVPNISFDPRLALALFVAPALLDAAYDLPPRELLQNWVPMVGLALAAVIATAFAVALLGTRFENLPFAAAITLGAIVAPPDAAAATAVLRQFRLPQRTLVILEGESLLNDAAALLIFGIGVSVAMSGSHTVTSVVPRTSLAVPGAVLLGFLLAKVRLLIRPFLAGTVTDTIVQFVSTFGVWILAEHLKVSPVLTVVVFAMVLAHQLPFEQSAIERVHTYAVWEAVVFVLNVFAFLLMGLQARATVLRLAGKGLGSTLTFALLVLVVVIIVRAVWVMISVWISHWPYWISVRKKFSYSARLLTYREGIVISWCGMRGLVTVATALALPDRFPERDLIVLTAFTVVLGTLLVQGLSLNWLIKALRIPTDRTVDQEVCFARATVLQAAIARLGEEASAPAAALKAEYRVAEDVANRCGNPPDATEYDRLRLSALQVQREALARLRREGKISDDAFHQIEEELDWSELSAAPRGYFRWSET